MKVKKNEESESKMRIILRKFKLVYYYYKLTITNPALNSPVPSVYRHENKHKHKQCLLKSDTLTREI